MHKFASKLLEASANFMGALLFPIAMVTMLESAKIL
jgi:hypothetical protein